VILSILSQNSAFGGPCNWREHSRNQSKVVIEGCESTKIDSTFLGRDSEEFSNLTHFEMHGLLTKIEEEQFVRAVNLETLDLSYNQIQHVAEWAFIKLHKLTILNLGYNEIRNLPMGVFTDLPILRHLHLGENYLTLFDFSIFKQNPQLKELSIFDNAITNVTTSQQYSSDLTNIDMESNSLTSLSTENLPVCLNLQMLRINRNNLTKFDFESVKDKFPKLENIYFDNNRFDCCFLVDSVNTMVSEMPNLTMDSGVIENLNDSITIQEKTKCTTCDRKIYDQRKIGELKLIIKSIEKNNQKQKVVIGRLQEQNRMLFNIVFALVIGIPLIIELIMVVYFQKVTN
jgi:Leucine rich repeat